MKFALSTCVATTISVFSSTATAVPSVSAKSSNSVPFASHRTPIVGGRRVLLLTTLVGLLFHLLLLVWTTDAAETAATATATATGTVVVAESSSSLDRFPSSSHYSSMMVADGKRLLKPRPRDKKKRKAKYSKKGNKKSVDVDVLNKARCNAELFEGTWSYQNSCADGLNVNIGCNEDTDICSYKEVIVDFSDTRRELDFCPVGGSFQGDSTNDNVYYYDDSTGHCVIKYFDFENDPCKLYDEQPLGAKLTIPLRKNSGEEDGDGDGDGDVMTIYFSNDGGKSYYNSDDGRIVMRGEYSSARDLQAEQEGFESESSSSSSSSSSVVNSQLISRRQSQCERAEPSAAFESCVLQCIPPGLGCVTCLLGSVYPPFLETILSEYDPINLGPGVDQTVDIPIPSCPTTVSVTIGVLSITGLSSLNFDGLRLVGDRGEVTFPTRDSRWCPEIFGICPFGCFVNATTGDCQLNNGSPPIPGTLKGTWTDVLRLESLTANTQATVIAALDCLSNDADATLSGTTSWNDASLQVTLSIEGEWQIFGDRYITLSEFKLDSIEVLLGNFVIGIDFSAWGGDVTQEFEKSFDLIVPGVIDEFIDGTIVDGVNRGFGAFLPQTIPL